MYIYVHLITFTYWVALASVKITPSASSRCQILAQPAPQFKKSFLQTTITEEDERKKTNEPETERPFASSTAGDDGTCKGTWVKFFALNEVAGALIVGCFRASDSVKTGETICNEKCIKMFKNVHLSTSYSGVLQIGSRTRMFSIPRAFGRRLRPCRADRWH